MGEPFDFRWLPDSHDHLGEFPKAARTSIVRAVLEQLQYQPTTETNHRKKLRPNRLANWELRIGDYRVFYEVIESDRIVEIVAIGRKHHAQIRVGGEEVEL
jgi:mRNA-degrading endonuclease RelE of RelBE toxin-antitoxin system